MTNSQVLDESKMIPLYGGPAMESAFREQEALTMDT
jgi:hypothetical protein